MCFGAHPWTPRAWSCQAQVPLTWPPGQCHTWGDRDTSFPSHLRSQTCWTRGLSSASHGIHQTVSRGIFGTFFHHFWFLTESITSWDPPRGGFQPPQSTPPGRIRSAENHRCRFLQKNISQKLHKSPNLHRALLNLRFLTQRREIRQQTPPAMSFSCPSIAGALSGTECKVGNYNRWDFLPS